MTIIAAAACAAMVALSAAPASAATHAVAATGPTTTVLTIGDSIMNGFGLADGSDWPTLLGQSESWSVTNAACDGAGVLQVGAPSECDSDFAGIIDSESTMQPDIVIFEGSSNDLGISNSALLAATIAELQTIHADFPSAQIVGLSTLWGYSTVPGQLAQIDSQVQQAVEAVGGTYIDLGQPFQGHPELMQASDVHPTAAGQALLAAAIQKDLEPAVAALQKSRTAAGDVAQLGDLVRLRDGE
jgi:acyl-CoA thioesterase-1